jgi:hypothetical protein
MPAPQSSLLSRLAAVRRTLKSAGRWLDEPGAEFGVYVTLILLIPFFRLGLMQIMRSIFGGDPEG